MTLKQNYKIGNRKCSCNAAFIIEKSEKTVNYGRGGMINRFFVTHQKQQIRYWVRCAKCNIGYYCAKTKKECSDVLNCLMRTP
jgi:hypothetical protein